MDITADEKFKAACHGLVMGCLLPVLAYNVKQRKPLNSLIYVALLSFEALQVVGHLRDDSHGS